METLEILRKLPWLIALPFFSYLKKREKTKRKKIKSTEKLEFVKSRKGGKNG
jgi:hypothetical protein